MPSSGSTQSMTSMNCLEKKISEAHWCTHFRRRAPAWQIARRDAKVSSRPCQQRHFTRRVDRIADSKAAPRTIRNRCALLRRGLCFRRILDVSIHPVVHLPEHVKHRFAAGIPMRFERQEYKTDRAALSFDGAEKSLALQGKVPVLLSASPWISRMGVLILSA